MVGACSAYGGEERHIQGFDGGSAYRGEERHIQGFDGGSAYRGEAHTGI